MVTSHTLGVYDEAGRYLGPAEIAIQFQPLGAWTPDDGAPPLTVICAWCDDFDRTDPANAGASHTICPNCVARLEREIA